MTERGAGGLRSSKVLHGSAWILVGIALHSVLGFAFWFLGSKVASSSSVGRAAALYTAIQFVNYASGLGLTVALARFAVDGSDEADALLGWGILATIASSFVFGSAYLVVADTPATRLVSGSVGSWMLFCVYTAGTSVLLVADVRLMAAGRWGWMVSRIAVAGVVRLALLPLDVGLTDDRWLYHLMLAPMAVVGFLTVPLLPLMRAGRASLARPRTLAAFSRYSGVNWAATLASQAPMFVLPLIVAQRVPSSVNASFFLAWTLTGLVLLLPGAIAQVLLVEGSKDVEASTARAREALLISLGLASLAFVGSIVGGIVVAALFGDDYQRLAVLLPSLMVAGIPWAITSVRLSEARIRHDQVATVLITATLGLGIVVPALLTIGPGGTDAAVRSFVGGNVAAALVAVVTHRRAGGRAPRSAPTT